MAGRRFRGPSPTVYADPKDARSFIGGAAFARTMRGAAMACYRGPLAPSGLRATGCWKTRTRLHLPAGRACGRLRAFPSEKWPGRSMPAMRGRGLADGSRAAHPRLCLRNARVGQRDQSHRIWTMPPRSASLKSSARPSNARSRSRERIAAMYRHPSARNLHQSNVMHTERKLKCPSKSACPAAAQRSARSTASSSPTRACRATAASSRRSAPLIP